MFDFLQKILHNIENTDAEGWLTLLLMIVTSIVFIAIGLRDYYKNREYYDNLPEEDRNKWIPPY